MTMACVIMQFNTTPVINQYDFTIHSSDRVRFTDGSIMVSQHTVPAAVDSAAHSQAVRVAAAAAGHARPMFGMGFYDTRGFANDEIISRERMRLQATLHV